MNITGRIKKIISQPKSEWDVISKENSNLRTLFKYYILPLSLIPTLASFIGNSFIGQPIPIIGNYASVSLGFSYALLTFLGIMSFFPITTVIIDALAPTFESEKNINKTAQLVAYSYTPSLLAGIFGIIPALNFIGTVLGLYSFYLMYLGLAPLKNTPEEKKLPYIAISFIIVIIIFACIWFCLTFILSTFGLMLKPAQGYSGMPS